MSDNIFPGRLKDAIGRSPSISAAVLPDGWEIVRGITKAGDKFWLNFCREWRPLQSNFIGSNTSDWGWLPVIRERKKKDSRLVRLVSSK